MFATPEHANILFLFYICDWRYRRMMSFVVFSFFFHFDLKIYFKLTVAGWLVGFYLSVSMTLLSPSILSLMMMMLLLLLFLFFLSFHLSTKTHSGHRQIKFVAKRACFTNSIPLLLLWLLLLLLFHSFVHSFICLFVSGCFSLARFLSHVTIFRTTSLRYDIWLSYVSIFGFILIVVAHKPAKTHFG